ncbi:MAG TPA: hypothetical protein VHQ03_02195 [Candidatus Dormibacteraeota bacterium]|nr:hypothetical protein [Candidatus Dormibacteraeota bacterium]
MSAISYRVGTYSSFREAMVKSAGLRAELFAWTARPDDDYGMALLDLWAYVADVLTFYQERTANESFMRTAELPESLRRLAAQLGYQPAPGSAAAAFIAFTLDAGKRVLLHTGLQVESVPGPGEQAQTFETSADLTADAIYNQVRIYGVPQPGPTPLELGSTAGPIDPQMAGAVVPTLSVGDRLVMYSSGLGTVEEKRLKAIVARDPVTILQWQPSVQQTGLKSIRKLLSTHRLFAYNAPDSYLKQYVDTNGEVKFKQVNKGDPEYSFALAAGSTKLQLDGITPQVVAGDSVMLALPPSNTLVTTVKNVSTKSMTRGQISGTVTDLELAQGLPVAVSDWRLLELLRVSAPDFTIWDQAYPVVIEGNSVLVRAEEVPKIPDGRDVIVQDASGGSQHLTVLSSETESGSSFLKIDVSPPIAPPLDAASAVMLGNVAEATQGKTVPTERLGNGDATVSFQAFKLRKSPVTYVPHPGSPHGVSSTLSVRAGGLLWEPRADFFSASARDRVYTTQVDDKGATIVTFGDSFHGALPATGAPITADYRSGMGEAGNVGALTLTSLLTKPVGLKSSVNPLPAMGGLDPEPMSQVRVNAPGSVRTFGRIVSLRDFEDAAREFGVAKAKASIEWIDGEETVQLVVGGTVRTPAGRVVGAQVIDPQLTNLVLDLNSRRDPNRLLQVVNYVPVPISIHAIVLHSDPAYRPDDVKAAAVAALLDHFDYLKREFGQPVHLSEVFAVVARAAGVVGVDLDRLQFKSSSDRVSHGASAAEVQPHLFLYPNEIASLDASDLEVTGP